MNEGNTLTEDPEFAAMQAVHRALEPLDPEARKRVLSYVTQRLGMETRSGTESHSVDFLVPPEAESENKEAEGVEGAVITDGISPVAVKWMRRAGLSPGRLKPLFSVDLDEIDLIAERVPGKSKSERLRNVFRLSAVAKYLATGAARVSDEELREACLHYDAYDVGNHAHYVKGLGREISGTKESGYTLTPSGITAATKLIQEMIKGSTGS